MYAVFHVSLLFCRWLRLWYNVYPPLVYQMFPMVYCDKFPTAFATNPRLVVSAVVTSSSL